MCIRDSSELLAQELLCVTMPAIWRRRRRTHAQPLATRCLFLRVSNLPFLSHAPQDDEAPGACMLEPVPRRIRRGRTDDTGEQGGFAQGEIRSRLAECALR